MNLEHWWNNPDRGKVKHSEKNQAPVPLCPHKSHMEWRGIETGPLQLRGLTHGTGPERYNHDRHLDHKLQGKRTWKGIFGAINCNNYKA
jgi:hypothetical protein